MKTNNSFKGVLKVLKTIPCWFYRSFATTSRIKLNQSHLFIVILMKQAFVAFRRVFEFSGEQPIFIGNTPNGGPPSPFLTFFFVL